MILHQLMIFTRVAEEKNFTRAAESVYLSQSTISTHISNLEKQVGHKLFDRIGKEAVMTRFGEKLYPYAKEMLALQEKALWELKEIQEVDAVLKIAASTVPAQYIVPELISQLSGKYHGMKFTVDSSDSRGVSEMLIKGEADIGILGNQYISDKLDYIPIYDEKLILAVPPDYDLPSTLSIKEITKFPFLFRKTGSGTQEVIAKTLHKAHLDISKLKVVGYFDSVQTIKQCIKEGLGVSIISELAVTDYVRQNLIKSIDIKEFTDKRTFYLAYNKGRTLSPLVTEFIELCRSKIRCIE